MIAAALVLLAVAAPHFAPATDVHYRLTSTATRSDGAATHRFTISYDVVFRPTADGYLAEIETFAPARAASGPEAMFAAAYASLAGQKLRYRLDRDGKLVTIDDLDRVWERYVAGIADMAGKANARAKVFADALRAQPPAGRMAILAAPLETIIAPIPPVGDQPVTFAARSAAGASTPLSGTRRVTRTGDGMLHVETSARSRADAAPALTVDTQLVIDPASGLTVRKSQRSVTTLGDRASISETTSTLARVS